MCHAVFGLLTKTAVDDVVSRTHTIPLVASFKDIQGYWVFSTNLWIN